MDVKEKRIADIDGFCSRCGAKILYHMSLIDPDGNWSECPNCGCLDEGYW